MLNFSRRLIREAVLAAVRIESGRATDLTDWACWRFQKTSANPFHVCGSTANQKSEFNIIALRKKILQRPQGFCVG